MPLIHPLHLVEIQGLIANHLDTIDLLACVLVCKAWSNSFRRALWRHVVASSTAPNFLDPHIQSLIHHIRHLEYRIHPSKTRLPTLGFTRLVSLKICPLLGAESNDLHLLWIPMTAIIHNLAHGPLSTLELCNDSATIEFWEALARCTALHTLILKNLRISGNIFPAFWRASFRFESLFLYNTIVNADDNHAPQHWYGARSRRLKHIVLEQNSVLRQSDLASLPWYCAPYLEMVRCSSGSVSRADMQALQLEIWRASSAARKGCVFYGAGTGDQRELLFLDQEDDEHLMGAESCSDIEQLHGLIPGRKIREFQCVLPPLNCEFCLAPIIRNMDALEKFSVGPLRHARHELAPLQQHVDTLVELDLWHCNLAEATLVRFLEQCPRLQVFVANRIQAEAVVKSRPWVCTGMRQLRVPLQSTPMSQLHSSVPGLDEEHEQLLERLAGLPCLERFYMPKYWYRCGLDRLRGLAHVQDVYFTATSIISLEEVDARWMVEHWPALKTVRMPAHNIEHNLSLGAGRVFENHGVECLQLVDGQCP